MFHSFIFLPLYNSLIFLVGILPSHNVGLAIIILTVCVRVLLVPFQKQALNTQRKLKILEPQITEIKKEAQGNKQIEAERLMALYREEKINPFASLIMLVPQIIILLGLFWVFKDGVNLHPEYIYEFITPPSSLGTTFLGINLAQKSILLALCIGVTQYLHISLTFTKPKPLATTKASFLEDFNRGLYYQMRYVMPAFIAIVSLSLPAAIGLYWFTGNVFAICYELLYKRANQKTPLVV